MLTSLHVQRYQGWHDNYLRDIGASWGKIVNPALDTPILPSVPHVLVRFWCDDVAAGYITRGYDGGRQFVRDQAERFRRVQANGKVLETWNEPDVNTNEGLIHLREATLGAIDEANAQGITLCILNLAEGNPHDNNTGNEAVVAWKWNELAPAIKAAVRYGHYLGRHCYFRPDVEGPTGRWHALGRLEADIAILKDLGVDVANLKILVNEWGIDGGIANHTPVQGWKILTDAATYRALIVEGERCARRIPQVQALMLFTSGYEGEWESYEHDVEFCGSLIGPLKAIVSDAIPEIPPIHTTKLLAPLRREDVVRVTQQFTPPSHYGIDYSCYEGAPVFASCDGIAYRGSQPTGFGFYIRIEDGAGLYVYAAHLRAWAVADGARVGAGDVIGYSGNTGNSTGPHLHFEVRIGSRYQSAAVDPEPMIEWPGETRAVLTTLHVQRYQSWQNAFLHDLGAQWGKIVDPPLDTDLFPDVPSVDARFWDDDEAPGYIARGREGGHAYVRDNLARWRRVRGRRVVFELPNEPECNTNVGLVNLCQFTLGAIEEADAQGVTLVILNLAEANPHDNDTHNDAVVAWKWDQLRPAINAAIRGGHYFGRHCYWRPDVEGPTGRWHALGRLKADLEMLRDLGVDVDNLKVLVTEWGIDGGIAGHTPEQGWQALHVPPEVYRAQIVEGERYARTELPQVEMMALFTAGFLGQWGSYDHDEGFCRTLVEPLKAAYAPAQPIPTPEPEPVPYLPSNDPFTLAAIETGDLAQIWPKRRWWNEDSVRKLQAGDAAGALAILEDMATPVTGLDYVIERLLT